MIALVIKKADNPDSTQSNFFFETHLLKEEVLFFMCKVAEGWREGRTAYPINQRDLDIAPIAINAYAVPWV